MLGRWASQLVLSAHEQDPLHAKCTGMIDLAGAKRRRTTERYNAIQRRVKRPRANTASGNAMDCPRGPLERIVRLAHGEQMLLLQMARCGRPQRRWPRTMHSAHDTGAEAAATHRPRGKRLQMAGHSHTCRGLDLQVFRAEEATNVVARMDLGN
jgi:hypothetical protein